MEVTIAGRHVQVTEPMSRHIQEHVDRLPRFDGHIQYITVALGVESGFRTVEVIAKCHKADLVAEAKSHDMYQSIDEAFAKMQRQIVRHHDKMVHNAARAAQRASETDKRPG